MFEFRPVLFVVGLLLLALAGAMLVPGVVELASGTPDWRAFGFAAAATLFVGGALVLAYDPTAACFTVDDASRDPIAAYVCGLECWASDLLDLLCGDLAPSALCYAGRMRHWNHAPARVRASPQLLWIHANPLQRPDRAARLYARLLAELDAPAQTLAYRLTSTSKTP